MQRPESNEYQSYYVKYVESVPDGNILDILREQRNEVVALFRSITEEQSRYRYLPEKWSAKEVLGHMTDTERIMSYRLLCIARGESVSLPGFDENEYVRNADFGQRTLESMVDEYAAVRAATLALLAGVSKDASERQGSANNNTVSVRALAYIIAGHERHHVSIIKERYIL